MRIFLLLTLFLMPFAASASDAPIEITADNELAWDRANQTVTASGNAIVTQGTDSLNAPTITASYSEQNDNFVIQSVIASGNATLTRPTETLTSQSMTAAFNNGTLSTITADNNVVLKTDTETLTGDRAVYNVGSRQIEVTGNVRILQDDNILEGSIATFDLNTSISTLKANPQTGGRVRAIFRPAQDGE